MNKVLYCAGIALLTTLNGCQYYFPPAAAAISPTTGKIVLAASFPNALSTKVIPGDTSTITVRVTGDNIPAGSVLTADLSPTSPKVTFVNVPVGAKSVEATAYDDTGDSLATGTTAVTIIAGSTVTATITLQITTTTGRFNLIVQ